MSRCVIVGGAEIKNYPLIRRYLKNDDFYIYCDSGLYHQKELDKAPNLIVGDFDSHPEPDSAIETIVLPCEKDDTDTVYAVKEALSRGYDEFLLIGVIGNRLDHSLGNVSVLFYLDAQGKKGTILDDYSEMELVSDTPVLVPDMFSYFSLLNISGTAKGVSIENAKYPLQNAEITCDYQYGISNEVLPNKTAKISVQTGTLLLVKIF